MCYRYEAYFLKLNKDLRDKIELQNHGNKSILHFSLGYPIGAPVKIINIGHYEDLRPWNNNFMLRSGANIFVSQMLVQGPCEM